MHLPYNRPRLIEIHEQTWCPPQLRQPLQDQLTYLWLHCIPPFQPQAPYVGVADVLERVVDEIEREDLEYGEKRSLELVDYCSGAGGPMPAIEKRLNQRRKARSQSPIQCLLTDLHPHTTAWQRCSDASPTKSLSFVPYSVDAMQAPDELKKERHLRTFFLSFHHLSEDIAKKVLEDAMRTSEGICIFELQGPDLGSIFTILGMFPLSFFIAPFNRPTWTTLFFTYIIPVIPALLTLDGLVSAWRTRSSRHIQHLANLAAMTISMESGDKDGNCEWKWEEGGGLHTRPFGRMRCVIGRRDRSED